MSDLRKEHAEREAASWAELEQALNAVPRARWDEGGVLEGWTIKEMLWHVAGWLDKCAGSLESTRDGVSPPAGTGETVDERNARFAAEAREMETDAVWEGTVAARERVLRAWESLPEIDRTVVRVLADETYEHYPDHVLDLAKFGG